MRSMFTCLVIAIATLYMMPTASAACSCDGFASNRPVVAATVRAGAAIVRAPLAVVNKVRPVRRVGRAIIVVKPVRRVGRRILFGRCN